MRARCRPASALSQPLRVRRVGALAERLLEALAQPSRQLGCGRLGERHHRDVIDAVGTLAQQLHHPLHEHRRLAGAGARLDHQRDVQRRADLLAELLIDRCEDGAHGWLTVSSTNAFARGSSALRSRSFTRELSHRRSKAQYLQLSLLSLPFLSLPGSG